MGSKKKAARRWKNRDNRSEFERQMADTTPEQAAGIAQQVSEQTGRPIDEVAEAMKSEAAFIMFLNDYMPKLGAIKPGDRVRPKETHDRHAYLGSEVVGEWLAEHPQEATVIEVVLRRDAKPVMVRVEPVPPATGEYLFMSKFDLELVEERGDAG